MRSTVVKNLLIIACVCMISCRAQTTRIDAIASDKDVIEFFKSFNEYRNEEIGFTAFRDELRAVADSLKFQKWVKTDINSDGKNDFVGI
jgi:hypothetical protein